MMTVDSQPPVASPQPSAPTPPEAGEPGLQPAELALYDKLRELRRTSAAEASARAGSLVPLFTILSNACLRDVARQRPVDLAALCFVRGIGKAKSAAYGVRLLEVLHSQAPKLDLGLRGADAVAATRLRVPAKLAPGEQPAREQAFAAFATGASLAEVQTLTGRAETTVAGYLAAYLDERGVTEPEPWLDAATCARVLQVAATQEDARLRPLFEALAKTVPYPALRVALAIGRNRARKPYWPPSGGPTR